ncbi:hypothetical protein ONZ45_g10308 [Pleurotus djamor]|nr:hypothetical protein ONZ45_g10308 [Pleurotus djamor]
MTSMDTVPDPSGAPDPPVSQPIGPSLPLFLDPAFMQLRGQVEDTQRDIADTQRDVADIKMMFQRLFSTSTPVPAAANPTPADSTIPDPLLPGVATSMHAPIAVEASSHLRPANPPIFDGSRDRGHQFLNAVKLYFAVRPQDFQNEQTKIAWTLSFFQEGQAAEFFRQYSQSPCQPYYSSWHEFEKDFCAWFLPEQEEEKARLKLESHLYHQGSRTFQEYYDSFVDLVDMAGYTEGPLIALKFCKGLSPVIQNHIAQSIDCPAMEDYKGWYAAAAKYARNQIANQSFNATTSALHLRSHPRPAPAPAPTMSRSPLGYPGVHQPGLIPRPPVPAPTPFAPKLSEPKPLPPGVPMDVDRTKAKRPIPARACFRCGDPSHIAINCPRSFDIRFLTSEEKLSLAKSILANADVEDSAASISRVEEVEEAPLEEREEDFVPTTSDQHALVV